MRKHFSNYIEKVVGEHDDIVFITGDLGYGALENLAAKMGDRFINAGVAEQNMIGIAAGMASQGYRVICYSIAPFVVYRCLEQIRNDVCFHNLPVFVVGNGGGYGYGIHGVIASCHRRYSGLKWPAQYDLLCSCICRGYVFLSRRDVCPQAAHPILG